MAGATGTKKGRPVARERKAGERVPLGLRVTADLKRDLDSAAATSGRSQSQEAEFRLENSFTLLNDPSAKTVLVGLKAFFEGRASIVQKRWDMGDTAVSYRFEMDSDKAGRDG